MRPQTSVELSEKYIGMTAKYVFLLTLAICSNAVINIVLALVVNGVLSFEHHLGTLFAFDPVINVSCLYLQYSFAHEAYTKYCRVLDACCKRVVCHRCFGNRSRYHSALELEQLEVTATAMNPFSMDKRPSMSEGHHGDNLYVPQIAPVFESKLSSSKRLSLEDFQYEFEGDDGFSFGVYLEYWRRNHRNSVIPKYKTLKEELTLNRHASIAKEQYDALHTEAAHILKTEEPRAKDIGIANNICGIPAGSLMKVDHMLSLKLYTDHTEVQREFKRHCRKLYRDEPLQSVITRNKSIALWCRHLKECIMFLGQTMSENERVYCGLKGHMTVQSFQQRFECPLSTTMSRSVAQVFAEGEGGIILTLQRANAKTRCLDVSSLSCFPHEQEKLFMGSTLKIINISIQRHSFEKYVRALTMFERIINGYFIDGDGQTTKTLLSLLHRVTTPSVMDTLTNDSSLKFLIDDDYDTDAVMMDIKEITSSNIGRVLSDEQKLDDIRVCIEQQPGTHTMTCLFSIISINYKQRIRTNMHWLCLAVFC